MNAKKNWLSIIAYFIVGIVALAVALAVIRIVIGLAITIISFAIGVAIVVAVGYVAYVLLKSLLKNTN
ncbi:MAG: hypothetical protein ABFD83_11620 [Armatimonadota bacterium]